MYSYVFIFSNICMRLTLKKIIIIIFQINCVKKVNINCEDVIAIINYRGTN